MSTWTEGDTESETSDRSERRDGSLDTATLNRLSIRRFTESTLTGYGGSVDRKEADRWEVTVPGSLINVAEGGHATLVFDPKDQEPGAKDILVRPGTPFFNALVDLARQERSVGHVHLGASELQLTVPPALKAGSLDASVTGFDVSSTELTVAFHFLVELESASSYQQLRFETVVLDPDGGGELPKLEEQFEGVLDPVLATPEASYPPREAHESVPNEEQLKRLYDTGTEVVQDRIEQQVRELRSEAVEEAADRYEEIETLYDQRRDELEIERRELVESQSWLQEQKNVLAKEEQKHLERVDERFAVEVTTNCIGVSLLSYEFGSVEVELSDGESTGNISVTCSLATDKYGSPNCGGCGAELGPTELPQLCKEGHVVCTDCVVSCESCTYDACLACDGAELSECNVCSSGVCADCRVDCHDCGRAVCSSHHLLCDTCEEASCLHCGLDCAECDAIQCQTHLGFGLTEQAYVCRTHLTACDVCGETHLREHLSSCDTCDDAVCQDHLEPCATCGDVSCQEHAIECTNCESFHCPEHSGECVDCEGAVGVEHLENCETCDESVCESHLEPCATCGDVSCQEHATECTNCESFHCPDHMAPCAVDDEPLCTAHARRSPVSGGWFCEDHIETCDVCQQPVGISDIDAGRCETCASLNEGAASAVPPEIQNSFGTVKAGWNDDFLVCHGHSRFGRDEVIVLDKQTGDEVYRHQYGRLKSIGGAL